MQKIYGILTAALLCTAAITAPVAQAQEVAEVTVAESVKFVPLDPNNPGGIQISVISGDMAAKGPVLFFAKIPKATLGLHTHSSDYRAVVILGQYKHFLADGAGTAQVMGPGSTWMEPAKRAHNNECVSEECLLLLQFEGGFDFMPQ